MDLLILESIYPWTWVPTSSMILPFPLVPLTLAPRPSLVPWFFLILLLSQPSPVQRRYCVRFTVPVPAIVVYGVVTLWLHINPLSPGIGLDSPASFAVDSSSADSLIVSFFVNSAMVSSFTGHSTVGALSAGSTMGISSTTLPS
ncbi:hypothetical protein ROHU_000427 [Labeo rohita]|uniref:Uncharacterized protein n=1 Tax=Labeo rohita TaxID=84645 RepID=A0A498P6W5_LABRO|nr:hypothetical protein ROHU_000427 [Labeo rohita]